MSEDMIVVSRKPIHPGEFLREDYMPELDLSVAKLAEKLGGYSTDRERYRARA